MKLVKVAVDPESILVDKFVQLAGFCAVLQNVATARLTSELKTEQQRRRRSTQNHQPKTENEANVAEKLL